MTMDSRYSWTRFYMELADKILAFRTDRQVLIELLLQVFADAGVAVPKLGSHGAPKDIDPFSVFALFNGGLGEMGQRRIAKILAEAFQLSSPVPDGFAGVSELREGYVTFLNLHHRRGGVNCQFVDKLWLLFDAAIDFSKCRSLSARATFVSLLDDVLGESHIDWKISVGLHWIRPYVFLSLNYREYYYLYNGVSNAVRKFLKSHKRMPQAQDYLTLCKLVDEVLEDDRFELSTFPELSDCAVKAYGKLNGRHDGVVKGVDGHRFVKHNQSTRSVRYWLYSPGQNARMWEYFYERGVMGLGWGDLGDLNAYSNKGEILRRLIESRRGMDAQRSSAKALWQFVNEMEVGDVVFVKRGTSEIVGRGVVTSGYFHDPAGGYYPNVRAVSWARSNVAGMDFPASMKTLTDITRHPKLLQFIVDSVESVKGEESNACSVMSLQEYSRKHFLDEVYMDSDRYDSISEVLSAKQNVILQGAPGVGKTFAAKRLAYSMMGVKDASRVMLVQFHQSYSYEDFIEGYRPSGEGFELVKGAFYSFCKKAADDQDNDYFFIIDEINRGNLSTIFGEMFMLIESDKRGPKNKLQLLYSRELFYVPRNVHIIGMMNTADRSLAMLDYALRRRFAFVELSPAFDSEGFRAYRVGLVNPRFEALVREVESLNRVIAEDESLGEGFCIGHSYFCNMDADTCTDAALASIVDYELIPMLKEYWFDEPGKVREWSDRLRRSLR